MDEAMKTLEIIWINLHGPPNTISADPEFLNKFANPLNYFNIGFEPTPARRHNKIGVVERKNGVLRLIVQKILKDAQHALEARSATISNE